MESFKGFGHKEEGINFISPICEMFAEDTHTVASVETVFEFTKKKVGLGYHTVGEGEEMEVLFVDGIFH